MAIRLTRRGFIAGTAGAFALHPFSARAQGGQAHLRLLETTDIHMHIFPYDYYSDQPVDTVGLARTADLINGIRAEATNSLLLDNGDFLQGNPMGDYMAYEKGMDDQTVHPVIAAFNALGIDAGTIGNHEFNYGLDFLMESIDDADFRSSSPTSPRTMGASPTEDETLVPPYVILDRELTDGAGETFPIRIGLIGFTPPQIMTWDRAHLEGKVEVRDIVETARAYIPKMREEGAEIIVALAHSGIGSDSTSRCWRTPRSRWPSVEGIDAILTGHSHLVFPGPDYEGWPGVDIAAGTIGGKPGVMAGFWGSHMGLVDLLLGARRELVADRLGRGRGASDLPPRGGPHDHAPGRKRGRGHRGGRGRARGDAGLCPRRGRADRRAAAILLRARRRRPLGADRLERAAVVPRPAARQRPNMPTCRCCPPPRRSRPADAAARNTTPTCQRARSRSRTSPTSTSTPTPSAR